jgi:hypothetical protein
VRQEAARVFFCFDRLRGATADGSAAAVTGRAFLRFQNVTMAAATKTLE